MIPKPVCHRCANCHRRGPWSFSFLGLRQLRWLCPGCAPEPTGLDLAIAAMWPGLETVTVASGGAETGTLRSERTKETWGREDGQ